MGFLMVNGRITKDGMISILTTRMKRAIDGVAMVGKEEVGGERKMGRREVR